MKEMMDKIQVNSPTILAAVAVAGIASTGVIAFRTGMKYQKDISPEQTRKEQVLENWYLFVPALASGVAAASCVIASQTILNRRNAALASAFTVGEVAYRQLREKVTQNLSKPKEQKLIDDIAEESVKKNPPPSDDREVIVLNGGGGLVFDQFSGRYFRANLPDLKKIETEMNRQILNIDYILLNDFYEALGLARSDMGDLLGFNHKTPLELDFGSTLFQDEPVIVISFRKLPVLNPHGPFN